MRKDIKERMIIMKKQDDIKPNFAELARQYNCDYRTIKKYYESVEESAKKEKNITSKLTSYESIIENKLELSCSAIAIFKFIQKQGYTGKYGLVKNYCRKYRQQQSKKATIRFESDIGYQAQVDWKE